MTSDPVEMTTPTNFIRETIDEDNATGKFEQRVHTRFPPEPNGYLHIGHARAIWLNFGIAEDYGGKCNLRFDDTNPSKEEQEFVDAIMEDIRWLGYDWADRLYFASDYFDQLYDMALELVNSGLAYVDHLSAEDIREYRGTLTEPGKNSPYRDRSIEENRDLFERMKNGEFEDGTCVLRAKIDMASPNMNMRDPVLYRIQHAHHHRTGDKWCIYPMYDFAHGQSDSIEKITHSLCSLEFADHRPLYDWFLDQLEIYHPQQIEFARINFTYTITSKRKLRRLVEEDYVSGWDDPRMPTLRGIRRRGFPPEAMRNLLDQVGLARKPMVVEMQMLEYFVREHLNKHSPRVMAVINPLKIVITNYPEDQTEMMTAVNNPEAPEAGTRQVPFSRELYIEQEDFQENPHRKFYRLSPGREVRLRYAYFITCQEVIKDENGKIIELRCTYDPATKGGDAPDGRRVKATLHWVAATHALDAEVRLYDHLFDRIDPEADEDGKDFIEHLNPNSLEVRTDCKIEPHLATAQAGDRFQFERIGYFCVDQDSTANHLIFNRTVTLRDQWARMQKQNKSK